MSAPNLTLPEADRTWLEQHAQARGFDSADDYARYLVAEERASAWWSEQGTDQQAKIRAHIDKGWRQSEAGHTVQPDSVIEELRLRSSELRSKQ